MAETALSIVNQVARIGERLARSPAERALRETAVRVEATDVQGIVFRGYGDLPACRYLLLRVSDPTLARTSLRRVLPFITPGVEEEATLEGGPERDTERHSALQVAFTHAGLAALGLPREALDGFSREFIAGITGEHRSRFLGDTGPSAPETWSWGGTATPAIHAVAIVYARDAGGLAAKLAEVRAELAGGFSELHEIETNDFSGPRRGVEHFGFADGISQPAIEGYHASESSLHRVKAGEFILGYVNEYGELTPRPLVPEALDPRGTLPLDIEGSGMGDFGRNGSYLVFRQLRQDVPTFRAVLDTYSRSDEDGMPNAQARELLAARMVGRWPSGTSLVHAPLRDDITKAHDNEFRYHEDDVDGLRCPIGSHVRRANPRDALPPEPGTEASLSINRRHRLIRRGRAYGPPLPEGQVDDVDRGLIFVAVNANISRQFEFVQHSWIADPRFNGLFNEADPIAGASDDNDFTAQGDPIRTRCTGLPRFVTVTGGGYFFLPGVRALRYLAELAP